MKSLLRTGATLLGAAAISLAATPAADAAVRVCNMASPHWLGDGYVALDPPVDSPAARYKVDLGKLPGNGVGLWGATEKSPALTICEGEDGGDVVVYSTDGTATDIDPGIVAVY